MLRATGLDVSLTGFWRGDAPPREVAGIPVRALGRTFDARFAQRAIVVMRRTVSETFRRDRPCDVVLARNLEMLAMAVAGARTARRKPAIVYEALDIHRFLLAPGAAGRLMRGFERALLARTDLLVTSSPAFLREHYEKRQFRQRAVPSLVVENKPYGTASRDFSKADIGLAPGPPWRVGWFGMIRCRRSADLLFALAGRRSDLLRVHIAGRPTRAVFPDLEGEAARVPGVEFTGPYVPSDLGRLYAGVHFNWAIDWFEDGGNSEWLLPNRIYEGGSHSAVPVARDGTETARWLGARTLGVSLRNPEAGLEAFLDALSPERFHALKQAACSAPRSFFVAGDEDCERLAAALVRAAGKHGERVGRRARANGEATFVSPPIR